MMKEKKTLQVVLLSILCFILTVLLGTGVLVTVSARRTLQERVLTAAVEKLPLEEIGFEGSSAAQFILDEFIADERVSVENVRRVMQEGTFSAFAAELMDQYNHYLTDGGEFPELNAEQFVQLIEENGALILEETGLEFLEPDKQLLRENLEAPLKAWNGLMRESLHKGISGFSARATVSLWLPITFGVLLLAVLVWMIVFYVRGGFSAGTALKVYSIALFIPCAAMLCGLFATDLVAGADIPFIKDSMILLYDTLLPVAGIGSLICVLLFITGIACGVISARKQAVLTETGEYSGSYDADYDDTYANAAPEREELPEEEPAEPEIKRQYCRNCGQPLVNPDAKFCYKCGNVQEHVNPVE